PDGGMATGTGFLIDRRGWVATNHHVVSMASTAARVKLYSGKKVEIEGIVALAPERDLAIVKLRELPSDMHPLDISFWAVPKVGSRVYAYGNPLYNEFSLVEGIVSRVLNTAEFAAQQPDSVNVLTKLGAPPDQLWIQTDAKVSQGNSGGPLLDERCRVIGVNTFANLDAQFGFASHVRYLKGLADTAPDQVTPLKPPSEIRLPDRRERTDDSQELALNKATLQKVFDAVEAFGWKPTTREEYRKLADMALIMTACREPENKDIPFDLSDLVDTLFSKIQRVFWTDEQLNAINGQAKNHVAAGRGIVLVGFVVAPLTYNNDNYLLIRAPGFAELFLVPLDKNSLIPTQGTRLMIFGVTTPQVLNGRFSQEPDAKVWKIRIINTHHTLGV
ncbi:MAG: trypsin-like peptidase domain-containing protein, partial [Pirellulaceae bacterium]|nr:trypsin-like peptidase domain-containing protein [Pirellulaceae bacterium]